MAGEEARRDGGLPPPRFGIQPRVQSIRGLLASAGIPGRVRRPVRILPRVPPRGWLLFWETGEEGKALSSVEDQLTFPCLSVFCDLGSESAAAAAARTGAFFWEGVGCLPLLQIPFLGVNSGNANLTLSCTWARLVPLPLTTGAWFSSYLSTMPLS